VHDLAFLGANSWRTVRMKCTPAPCATRGVQQLLDPGSCWEGVKLDTIKKLLDTTGGTTEQVVHFIRTVRQLFAPEERQIVHVDELTERFGAEDGGLLRRAQKMDLAARGRRRQYEEISPR